MAAVAKLACAGRWFRSVEKMLNNIWKCAAAVQMVVNRTHRDFQFTGPVGNAHRPAIEREKSVRSLISVLLATSCPSHISRLVVPIIVDPVDAVSFARTNANMCEKVLESSGASPVLADRYSTTAIIHPSRAPWIKASLDYCFPYRVLSCPGHSVSGDNLAMKTATTPSHSRAELIKSCFTFSATTTKARNVAVITFPAQHSDDGQSSVNLARNIHRSRVPSVHAQTAARSDITVLEIGGSRFCGSATFASTKPQGMSTSPADPFHGREASKFRLGKIIGFWHPSSIASYLVGVKR